MVCLNLGVLGGWSAGVVGFYDFVEHVPLFGLPIGNMSHPGMRVLASQEGGINKHKNLSFVLFVISF